MRFFAIGDRVSQATYGAGTIKNVNEYHTVIDFDEHGTRTFSTQAVKLEPSNTTAPPKPATRRRAPRAKTAAPPSAKA